MITSIGKYYLYRHIRLDKQEPFYIGVGTKRGTLKTDFIKAYYRAFTPNNRTHYWRNIVFNFDYEVDILVESDDKFFILEKEKEFIKLYGRKDLKTGTLVNLNDGGGSPKNISHLVINKILNTKKERGNLSNAKNLREWEKSPNYKHSKARFIHVYSSSGDFLQSFNSISLAVKKLELKCGGSYLTEVCDKRIIYKNKYIFSWAYLGGKINPSDYGINKMFYRPVLKVCPFTLNVVNRFKSILDASREVKTTLANIQEAVVRKGSCKGFYWVDESDILNIGKIKFTNPYRAVLSIDINGQFTEYRGARVAEKEFGLSKGAICKAIKGGYKCKGYNWAYKTEKQS